MRPHVLVGSIAIIAIHVAIGAALALVHHVPPAGSTAATTTLVVIDVSLANDDLPRRHEPVVDPGGRSPMGSHTSGLVAPHSSPRARARSVRARSIVGPRTETTIEDPRGCGRLGLDPRSDAAGHADVRAG